MLLGVPQEYIIRRQHERSHADRHHIRHHGQQPHYLLGLLLAPLAGRLGPLGVSARLSPWTHVVRRRLGHGQLSTAVSAGLV